MIKEYISTVLGIFTGILAYFLGGFDYLLSVFATILVIDTITGMLKAWNLGDYQSKKFRQGFIKKSGYLLGIILAVQMDILLGDKGVLRDSVVTFFVANESFSIIENLGQMGVKFPEIFTNALKALSKEETEDKED